MFLLTINFFIIALIFGFFIYFLKTFGYINLVLLIKNNIKSI